MRQVTVIYIVHILCNVLRRCRNACSVVYSMSLLGDGDRKRTVHAAAVTGC